MKSSTLSIIGLFIVFFASAIGFVSLALFSIDPSGMFILSIILGSTFLMSAGMLLNESRRTRR